MKPSNRRQKREFRQRVDALHRAYHRRPQPTVASLGEEAPAIGDLVPFTLAHEVVEQASRKYGQSDVLVAWAQQLAGSFGSQEPNNRVRAAWAVEQAQMELSRGLSFDHAYPDLFIGGTAYQSRQNSNTGIQRLDWSGLHRDDLESIRHLNPTVHEDVVSAKWAPTNSCRVYDSDPIRPPVESLALIRQQVLCEPNGFDSGIYDVTSGSVLGIGLGFAADAQALSALLPHHHVHHIPVPYFTPQYEMERLTQQGWDLVVIGIPSLHFWQVAKMLSSNDNMSYLKHRAILQGKYVGGNPSAHVEEILDVASRFLKPNTTVALVGAPEPYQVAISSLQSSLEPLPDTSSRAVWVDYEKQPWAPHDLPRPTGRLVSFWRVK